MPTKIRRPRIRIDREFRALIPPLTPGERAQLEENIVAAGRATDPLALWGDGVPSATMRSGASR